MLGPSHVHEIILEQRHGVKISAYYSCPVLLLVPVILVEDCDGLDVANLQLPSAEDCDGFDRWASNPTKMALCSLEACNTYLLD